jgi:hypothetical protein
MGVGYVSQSRHDGSGLVCPVEIQFRRQECNERIDNEQSRLEIADNVGEISQTFRIKGKLGH